MATATVTSKGQLTLPKEVRDDLGVCAGDRIDFVRMANGQYAIIPKTLSIKSLKGILAETGRVVTLEEMDAAIEAGALRKR